MIKFILAIRSIYLNLESRVKNIKLKFTKLYVFLFISISKGMEVKCKLKCPLIRYFLAYDQINVRYQNQISNFGIKGKKHKVKIY